jgi:RES domain-containing protein
MPHRAVRLCARTLDVRRPSGRPNRWNAQDQLVLYFSRNFGTAVLESVVHASAAPPPPTHASWVTIPDDVTIEQVDERSLPAGWDDPDDPHHARRFAARWYAEQRAAFLVVPSLPGRPYEQNLVLNTTHPDAGKVRWERAVDIPWDPRLFG